MKQLADLHIFEALQQHADNHSSEMAVFNADSVVIENGIAETIGKWAGKTAAIHKNTVEGAKRAVKDVKKGFTEGYTGQKPTRMFNPVPSARGDTNTLSQNGLLNLSLGYVQATLKESTKKVAAKYKIDFNRFPNLVQTYQNNYNKVKDVIAAKVKAFAADLTKYTKQLSDSTVAACEKTAQSGAATQEVGAAAQRAGQSLQDKINEAADNF